MENNSVAEQSTESPSFPEVRIVINGSHHNQSLPSNDDIDPPPPYDYNPTQQQREDGYSDTEPRNSNICEGYSRSCDDRRESEGSIGVSIPESSDVSTITEENDGVAHQNERQTSRCFQCFKTFYTITSYLCKIVLTEVLPWVVGCYLIFYAFKFGGLGLGFSIFLVMVAIHGLWRWWGTRQNTVGSANENQMFLPPDLTVEGAGCSAPERASEPPPSYDRAVHPTIDDLAPSLDVHLKPKEAAPVEMAKLSPKHFLPYFDESRRGSSFSMVSYFSSEAEDGALPSYNEAVRKIRKKKRKARAGTRSGRSVSECCDSVDVHPTFMRDHTNNNCNQEPPEATVDDLEVRDRVCTDSTSDKTNTHNTAHS